MFSYMGTTQGCDTVREANTRYIPSIMLDLNSLTGTLNPKLTLVMPVATSRSLCARALNDGIRLKNGCLLLAAERNESASCSEPHSFPSEGSSRCPRAAK